MSIDIDLVINTGNGETTVVDVGNMTHNVQPMWVLALKTTSSVDMDLCDFDGWLASDAVPLLDKALVHMRDHESEYTPLTPSNGWGNYETAVEYLSTFMTACREHPLCTIRTNC